MKRMLLSLIVLLAAGWMVAPAALAQAGVYAATVPVAGTSDAQRDAAIGSALTQVLQQVAPGFKASPAVLAKAPGYVRNFHYKRAASGNGLELQVEFDPGAVQRLVGSQAGGATSGGSVAQGNGASPASGGTAAAPAAQGGSGTVWVGGIDNAHAFASLLSTLRGDNDLSNVTPVGAQNDGVLLQMNFDQPLATVLAALTGPAGHLAADPQPHPGALASLRWVP